MGNMSYCRFENTVSDFQDCLDDLEDRNGDLTATGLEDEDILSNSEFNSAIELIEKARELVEQFEDVNLEDVRNDFSQLDKS